MKATILSSVLIFLACTGLANAEGNFVYKFRAVDGQWVTQDQPPPADATDAIMIDPRSGRVYRYQPGLAQYLEADSPAGQEAVDRKDAQ